MTRAFTVLTLSMALAGCSLLGEKSEPDPASGTHTQMTLRVEAASGVEEVRRTVESRAKAAGFNAKAGADGQQVTLTVAGEVAQERLRPLAAPGLLRFHKVLELMEGGDTQQACAQLAAAPVEGMACDRANETKYRLGEAKVAGTDISRAEPELDSASGQWLVGVSFTKAGQDRWTALTRDAYNNQSGDCVALGNSGNCLVAMVLDGIVISAPEILGVLTGDSQIVGSFTREEVEVLAAQLNAGELPVAVEVVSVEVVR